MSKINGVIKIKVITMLLTLLFAGHLQATQLCYNPQNDLAPKLSVQRTDQFIELIEKANKMDKVLCLVIESDKALKSAQELVSNSPTENTFWIE